MMEADNSAPNYLNDKLNRTLVSRLSCGKPKSSGDDVCVWKGDRALLYSGILHSTSDNVQVVQGWNVEQDRNAREEEDQEHENYG